MSPRPLRGALLAALPLLLGCSLWKQADNGSPAYRRAAPPVAFAMLRDSPGLFILDLRTPEEYQGPLGHLVRSTNLPLETLSQTLADLPARFVELSGSQERTFLVYCRGGDECGELGMALLREKGFRYPVLMEGGIEAWVERGFGTVRSDENGEDKQVPLAVPNGLPPPELEEGAGDGSESGEPPPGRDLAS